jgi:FkbM family methyltransferase
MPLPLDVIIEFETTSASPLEYDWEMVLENGYRQFLDSGSTGLDVGEHVGRHAAIFIYGIHCDQIRIFEPLPEQNKFLSSHFSANENVKVFPFALASVNGETEFVINHKSPEESGIKERIYNDPALKELEKTIVPMRRLDDLNLDVQRIDYIKVDAEGGEIDIIKGAKHILKKFKPILSVEYGLSSYTAYGYSRTTLFELFESLDYTLCDLFGNSFDAEQWDNVVDRFYWDYYAVANEHLPTFQRKMGTKVFDELESCRFSNLGESDIVIAKNKVQSSRLREIFLRFFHNSLKKKQKIPPA